MFAIVPWLNGNAKKYFKGKVETIATNHLDNLIHNGIFIDHLPEQINW
jgi:hypothetical protein